METGGLKVWNRGEGFGLGLLLPLRATFERCPTGDKVFGGLGADRIGAYGLALPFGASFLLPTGGHSALPFWIRGMGDPDIVRGPLLLPYGASFGVAFVDTGPRVPGNADGASGGRFSVALRGYFRCCLTGLPSDGPAVAAMATVGPG